MNSIKKVLVPLDFSENSPKLLRTALFYIAKLEAQPLIIYVVEELSSISWLSIPHISFDILGEELVKAAKKKMDNFLEENMPADLLYKAKVVSGDVPQEIIDYAGLEGVDLIIIGTHGYKGLEKIIMGSVAAQVLQSAPCPVLAVNPYKLG